MAQRRLQFELQRFTLKLLGSLFCPSPEISDYRTRSRQFGLPVLSNADLKTVFDLRLCLSANHF